MTSTLDGVGLDDPALSQGDPSVGDGGLVFNLLIEGDAMHKLILHSGNGATLTMSSREIAELTEKRHDHVMRDIRKMLEALGKDAPNFGAIYKDAYGRDQQEYRLDRELTMTLVSGYDIPLQHRVVTKLAELEQKVGAGATALNPANLSRLQLIETAMQAEQERLALENKVCELEPKAEALDRIADAEVVVNTTTVRLNEWKNCGKP